MKRKNHLYENIYKMENIKSVCNEICRNTRNKSKVYRFREYQCINISRIYNTLKNREYVPGPYNRFIIYEPKKRMIVSQNMFDKAVNHLVARFILMPALTPCLIEQNVASRLDKGTSAGVAYFQEYQRICCVKYPEYYILKCDVSRFFYSINHERLKDKLRRRIKDKDALNIVFSIIDSEKDGLGIGNMTSQLLAIFYLNDMDHYIKEKLKIRYYIRYQDDFVLFHPSKEYLKFCLKEIKDFLIEEKLQLNPKTRIYKHTNQFLFLGRRKNGRYARYRDINRKIKKRLYLYSKNRVKLDGMANTLICYKSL